MTYNKYYIIISLKYVFMLEPTPPPNDVQLIAANPKELVFNWSSPSGSCPSLTYHTDTENCGMCQNLTTTNTTTCTNFILSTVCTMKVYSITCGNLTSNSSSNVVRVNLTGIIALLL